MNKVILDTISGTVAAGVGLYSINYAKEKLKIVGEKVAREGLKKAINLGSKVADLGNELVSKI